MRIGLLYNKYFDHTGENRLIGGIETYLTNLAVTFFENGWEPVIYQHANESFLRHIENDIPVIGLPLLKNKRTRNKDAYELVKRDLNSPEDIVIFGADHVSTHTEDPRSIAIQHGVFWDLPSSYMSNHPLINTQLGKRIKKWRVIKKQISDSKNCKNMVCVDYNFLNWYRTILCNDVHQKLWIVLNSTPVMERVHVESKIDQDHDVVRILFARRFVPMRGTRIMAEVAERIMSRNNKVHFTFAGEGPDEELLRSKFINNSHVRFIKYLPSETLDITYQHDISVIPSIASEGTTLSAVEAMAGGCAVVASAVGGLTNMIIHGYNGLLCQPNANEFCIAIEKLIENKILYKSICCRAYDTAQSAFSIKTWKETWIRIIDEVSSNVVR